MTTPIPTCFARRVSLSRKEVAETQVSFGVWGSKTRNRLPGLLCAAGVTGAR